MSDWPDDADGDALRRLEASGLDFSTPHHIDFNVDFERSPPPEAISALAARYGEVLLEGDDEGQPYLLFRVHAPPTYELVIRVQAEVSDLMEPFGGICDSWGVLHGPK